MKFGRWVVFTFCVQMLVIALDKGAGLILSSLLASRPDAKGAADMISNLPFLATAVANLGFGAALVYHVRRKRFSAEAVAGTAGWVALVWGTTCALLLFVLSHTVGPLLVPGWSFDWIYVLPICACLPLMLTASYANSLQLALDKVRDYNLVHLAQSAVFLPLFFVLFFALAEDAPVAMAFGRLGTALVIAVLAVWMLRTAVPMRARFDGSFLRAAIAFGWKSNLNSIFTIFSHRIDLYLVATLFVVPGLAGEALDTTRFAEAAFYSLAATLAQLVWHFPEATRDLFFSKTAGQTEEESRRFTPVVCRLCLAAAVAGGLFVLAIYDPLMRLIQGRAWNDLWSETVGSCLWILLPGALAYTVAKVLQNDLAARGHLNQTVIVNGATLALMLVLDWLWIPGRGALGAAWGSTVSFTAAAVYTLVVYRASGGAGVLETLVPRRSDWAYARDVLTAVRERLVGRRR